VWIETDVGLGTPRTVRWVMERYGTKDNDGMFLGRDVPVPAEEEPEDHRELPQ